MAVIETYETLNIPEFLIGRWNIRVQLAYKGLLWVGGAQVDPGFRGYLSCPIYNLSTEPLKLRFQEKLAMIDFVTTTRFKEGECERFDWRSRRMLLFSDYPLLDSGIEAEVRKFGESIQSAKTETISSLDKANENTKTKLGEIHNRIDTFLGLVFTVVAVLFAGLGIVATTTPAERSFINPPAWVAAIALYFALRSRSAPDAARDEWFSRRVGAFLIAGAVILASLAYHAWETRVELGEAKEQTAQAISALAKERQDREAAISQLRLESDSKLNNLRQQLTPRKAK